MIARPIDFPADEILAPSARETQSRKREDGENHPCQYAFVMIRRRGWGQGCEVAGTVSGPNEKCDRQRQYDSELRVHRESQ